MKKINYFLLITIFLFSSCGFKIINQSKLVNFYISDIEVSGDSRINYIIKRKLLFNSKSSDKDLIIINLNTIKSKSIKEKNIKNEIVKYQISINVDVKIHTMTNKNIKNFNVNKNGDYNVANQHSQTIDNEKKLIELLSESLADNILEELIFRFND